MISVDMGCVGEGLNCTEHQVSICAKDSTGPYNYDVVKKMIEVSKENNIDFDGVVGVSAGAAFGCSFISKQIGRALRYNLKFCKDKRYCSMRYLNP